MHLFSVLNFLDISPNNGKMILVLERGVKDVLDILEITKISEVIFMKRIILTGGGTAGHVTPNIALIPKLKELGYDIQYIGSYEGIENILDALEKAKAVVAEQLG